MPKTADRPLSPHLQVYRPMYTMVLSILHRASGLVLSATGFLFVAWLASAALGPDAYACVAGFLSGGPMRIAGARARAADCCHPVAGRRAPPRGAGYGFEKKAARRSGAIVVLLAAAAFAATLLLSPAGRFLAGLP